MSNPELISYIQAQIDQGVPPARIREALIGGGWLPELVDEALQERVPALKDERRQVPSSMSLVLQRLLPKVFKDQRHTELALWFVTLVCITITLAMLRSVWSMNTTMKNGAQTLYQVPSSSSTP